MTSGRQFSLKSRQAFSLVEVLVVISVIGIIASLVLPNLSDITNRAYFSKNERNAQTIASQLAAARSAGATNQWTSVDSAIDDLENTIRVKVGPSEFAFGVPKFTAEQRAGVSRYLAVDTNAVLVYYTGPSGSSTN